MTKKIFLGVLVLTIINSFSGFSQHASVKQPGGSMKLQKASTINREILFSF
jgi:hypothetical protein